MQREATERKLSRNHGVGESRSLGGKVIYNKKQVIKTKCSFQRQVMSHTSSECCPFLKQRGWDSQITSPIPHTRRRSGILCPTLQGFDFNDCFLNPDAPEMGGRTSSSPGPAQWPWVRPSTPLPQFLHMENEGAEWDVPSIPFSPRCVQVDSLKPRVAQFDYQ